jgi:TatD DNase family protein
MTWCDTHCHLDAAELAAHLPLVWERAGRAGVKAVIVPGVRGMVPAVLPDQPGILRAWGVHPLAAAAFSPARLAALAAHLDYDPIAIGECGLDTLTGPPLECQEPVFLAQIALAQSRQRPLLVHLRGAWRRALDLLIAHGTGVPWVMHAFSGSWEVAREFLAAGAFLSFAGSLCLPHARKTPRVARLVPPDRLLLETDAPDLKPGFWRHPTNEPAALPGIANTIARLRGVSLAEVRSWAAANTVRVFGPRARALLGCHGDTERTENRPPPPPPLPPLRDL